MAHQHHSDQPDPKVADPHYQEVPPKEVKHSKAGARGVKDGGNAGARGDPVSDQSRHNYQVSRDSDPAESAESAASYEDDLKAAHRREEIDEARMNRVYNL